MKALISLILGASVAALFPLANAGEVKTPSPEVSSRFTSLTNGCQGVYYNDDGVTTENDPDATSMTSVCNGRGGWKLAISDGGNIVQLGISRGEGEPQLFTTWGVGERAQWISRAGSTKPELLIVRAAVYNDGTQTSDSALMIFRLMEEASEVWLVGVVDARRERNANELAVMMARRALERDDSTLEFSPRASTTLRDWADNISGNNRE
jgi:hypothetical protein